jgi:hypothetical protein
MEMVLFSSSIFVGFMEDLLVNAKNFGRHGLNSCGSFKKVKVWLR